MKCPPSDKPTGERSPKSGLIFKGLKKKNKNKWMKECSFSVQNWTRANFTVQWRSLTLPHFLHSIRRQVSCAKPYFNWLVAISLHVSLVQKQSKYSVQIFFFFCNSKWKYLFLRPHAPPLPGPQIQSTKNQSNLLQSPPIYTDSVASRNKSFLFFYVHSEYL